MNRREEISEQPWWANRPDVPLCRKCARPQTEHWDFPDVCEGFELPAANSALPPVEPGAPCAPTESAAVTGDGGPGYDRGSVLWHSSEEDGGPDCGIQVGLGGGYSLYFGELADRTLEEHGVEPVSPSGWWAKLYGPGEGWIIGPIADRYVAKEALEHIAGRVR